MKQPANNMLAESVRRSARGVAVVSGVFSLVVCIVIIGSHVRRDMANPLSSSHLEQLRTKLGTNPAASNLKQEIRALDLNVRESYFASLAFLRYGIVLLLGGIATLVIALKTTAMMDKAVPDPGRLKELDAHDENTATARWLVSAVAAVFSFMCLALLCLYRSNLPVTTSPTDAPAQHIDAPSTADTRPGPINTTDITQAWPCFRGPAGNAVAHCTNAPVAWNGANGRGIAWKTPVPRPGFSSPIVYGNSIFVTGGDKDTREVYCFDRHTGTLRWRRQENAIPGSPLVCPDVMQDTGFAASTMATDGQRVFAIFPTGILICLNVDGDFCWSLNLGVPSNPYGHASSLITHDNLLIVQFDHQDGPRLLAVNTTTGGRVWTREREVETSWASPIIINTGQRPELIVNAPTLVMSYAPRTGEELWRFDCMAGEVAPSPAYSDGLVFVCDEFASLAAIAVRADPAILWHIDDSDYLGQVASPLAAAGLVFIATSDGTVLCFEAKTGSKVWEHQFGGCFYSSPILVGNRVYVMEKSGVMHIFDADKTYTPRGAPALGERTVATPAFLDGQIYIRGYKNLYCIGDSR